MVGYLFSVTRVFDLLRGMFDFLPDIVRWLVIASFGAVVFICVMKGVGR